MGNIVIRKYSVQDEESIVRMTEGKYAEDLSGYAREKIIVAEWDSKVVGYAYSSPSANVNTLYVVIYVSPQYRRCKVGTTLYQVIEAQCLKEGYKEIHSNYYQKEGTTEFVSKFDVTYITSSDIMKYSGDLLNKEALEQLLAKEDIIIRQYTDKDFWRYESIWVYGSYEMHKRIGVPVEEAPTVNEAYREQYYNDRENAYVLERKGQIIGMGAVSGDMIGCLAIDTQYNNCGYGTALAMYLTNELFERGNKDAYITCETGNNNALHIYEKIGYKKLYTDYWAIKKL